MNPTYELTGKVDVSMNGVTIPAQYISDEGVTTTLTEMVKEIPTMAGTFRQATGIYEEANAGFSVTLPNMYYAKNIFPELFTASNDRPNVAGQIVFGGNDCSVRAETPVVIHYSCQDNSDNDLYIPSGQVVASIELVQNASDPVTLSVTVQAQPSEALNGAIAILGTGSLDEPTIWDAETEEYVPVESS